MRRDAVLAGSQLPSPHEETSHLEFGILQNAGPKQHKPTQSSKRKAKIDPPSERTLSLCSCRRDGGCA
jgi:hypothetical protein